MSDTIQNKNIQHATLRESESVWKKKSFSIYPPFSTPVREGFSTPNREGLEDANGNSGDNDKENDAEDAKDVDDTDDTEDFEDNKANPSTNPSGVSATPAPPNIPSKPQATDFTADFNYRNIELPAVVAPPTRKSWIPPPNMWYNSLPNGLNNDPGNTSDILYSPSKDSEFIKTTIAKVADIITPPPPVPIPKPTRPVDSFGTILHFREEEEDADPLEKTNIQEPLSSIDSEESAYLKSSSDVTEKQKLLVSSWKAWGKNTSSLTKLRVAVTATVDSIYETFYIPELISLAVVNPSYNLRAHKSFYSREDFTVESPTGDYDGYSKDVTALTKQIKMFVLTAFSFFAAFNWWYVIIYTNHYLDINNFLLEEMFAPLNWVVGPALGPTAGFNYFLLGMRLKKTFYNNVINPIVENKWASFTVYLIVFMVLYRKFAKYQSQSFSDIMKGEPNDFYKTIMIFGILFYFFGIQAKGFLSPFWRNIIKLSGTFGVIILCIYLLLLFIVTMLLLKFTILFIIIYFMFYSYWSIVILGGGPQNLLTHITRIISDSTEICDVANPLNDPTIAFITWFKKNLTHIFIGTIYFALIVQLFDDVEKNMVNPTVKRQCNSIYSLLLIVQICMVIWINRQQGKFANIDDVLSNATNSVELPKASSEAMNEEFVRYSGLVGKFIYILSLIPFTILDYLFSPHLLFKGEPAGEFTRLLPNGIYKFVSGRFSRMFEKTIKKIDKDD